MHLGEQTVIKHTDPRYRAIDAAAFASKNLYNVALYQVRQTFIATGLYLNYTTMDTDMKHLLSFCEL